MAEEKQLEPWQIITETGNLDIEEQLEEQEPEVDPVEAKARDKGWVPQNEWEGNPEDWRPAREYMDRSSFFQRINNQKHEIEELRRDNQIVQEHLRKLRESQNKATATTLEAAKIEALESGEYNRVAEIDRQIREVEQDVIEPAPQQPTTNPEADPRHMEWVNDNPWYNNDTDLRVQADAFGISYRQNNPNASADEVYNYVTSQVKRVNPDKFNTRAPAESRAPSSVTSATPTVSTSQRSFRDLNEDQLRVGRRFVKLGLYGDIQEYVDELSSMGEI